MYLGQVVTYVDTHGNQQPASVVGIPDTGASGFKVLDLSTGASVSYRDDAAKGAAYWLLGDEPHDGDRRAPIDAQPIALAVAESVGILPDVDRRNEDDE